MSLKAIVRTLLLAALCAASLQAGAQTYPNRAIRLVVPYTPGGLPDVVARVLAQRLGEALQQPVTVDNRPGAVGSVAAGVLLSAPADGYSLMLTDTAMLTVGPLLPRSLPFDPKRDFTSVALVGNSPLYMVLNPRVPANNLEEFVAYARSKPGGVSYGSSGPGSIHHLAAEAVGSAMKLSMTHVPYKGSSASVAALVGGQVDLVFTAHSNIAGFARSGQARPIAVSTATRSPTTPALPALGEAMANYDYSVTLAVFARAGTPEPAIAKVHAELAAILRRPDVQSQLNGLGMTPLSGGPAELDQLLKTESARMAELFRTATIKTD